MTGDCLGRESTQYWGPRAQEGVGPTALATDKSEPQLADLAALLAAGYLRHLSISCNPHPQAQLQPPDSVYSPCYAAPPET
jgi:hypothetical protein